MAIEQAGNDEGIQLEIVPRSVEEMNDELFQLEEGIQELRAKKAEYQALANARNNDIKAKERTKLDLMAKIRARKGNITTVVHADALEQEPEDDAIPTDEELAAFAEQEPKGKKGKKKKDKPDVAEPEAESKEADADETTDSVDPPVDSTEETEEEKKDRIADEEAEAEAAKKREKLRKQAINRAKKRAGA